MDDGNIHLIQGAFPKDWLAIKAAVGADPSPKTWTAVADVVLRGRLNRLYFDPIHNLTREPGERGQGEGFAILTIQWPVIEFLAALRKGWSFKHGHKEQGKDNYYGNSKLLYTTFLSAESPFADAFTSQQRADEFYTDIRLWPRARGADKEWLADMAGTGLNPAGRLREKGSLSRRDAARDRGLSRPLLR